MQQSKQVEQIVYRAIDRVNEVLLEENALAKAPDTILLGPGAVLDSMGFVNFVVALEEEFTTATGQPLKLTEELNARDTGSKPATIGELVAMLSKRAQVGDLAPK